MLVFTTGWSVAGVWSSLVQLVRGWAGDYGTLHTVLGPVFDHDADGLWDVNSTV